MSGAPAYLQLTRAQPAVACCLHRSKGTLKWLGLGLAHITQLPSLNGGQFVVVVCLSAVITAIQTR